MRTRRLIAALVTPLVVVACATGTAPIGGGGTVDGGAGGGGSDASYGADDTGAGSDSGSSNKDGGITRFDSGGGGGIDSGGGGGGGEDCVGDTDSSGTSYNTDCNIDEFFGLDQPCTPGGSDCSPLGECCYSNTSKSCIAANGPQCVSP